MQKIFLKKLFILVIPFIIIITAINCRMDDTSDFVENNQRGKILDYSLKSEYSLETLKFMLNYSGIYINIELKYDVQAYKILYQTITANGDITEASGTIFIPLMAENSPLLSLQHGTIAKQNNVPSDDPLLTPESFMLSSEGFVVCIPDYLGLGISPGIHPYLHAQLSSNAVIDFLRTSKVFCSEKEISLNDQLFLAGYSEGGYVTLATQKELEQNYSSEFNITAVAPMAGPYDLKNNSLYILSQEKYSNPAYIAYQIVAYNNIYSWNRLNDFFNPLYAGSIESLFSGSYSMSEINARLPENINELLTDSFIANILNGKETDVLAALEENSLLNWTPKSPIRFYHGDLDKVVPYFNSETAVQALKSNGGMNIDLITIDGGSHNSSFFQCFILAHEWFRSL